MELYNKKNTVSKSVLTERDNVGSILSKLRSASVDVGVGFDDVVVESVPDGIFFVFVFLNASDLNYKINQRFWSQSANTQNYNFHGSNVMI